MGIFGSRKKDSSSEPSSTVDQSRVDQSSGIDFAKYELDQLGTDIRSIVDMPGAIGQALKYVIAIPVVVGIGTWLVFSPRMATVVAGPFSLVAFLLSVVGAIVIGGFFVARKRLDLVASASNRVVDVIGEMHADVMRVKDGHSGTSVQGVAIGLLENAIFPAVFGTINTTAETALGPLGRFTSKVTKAPMNMVQKSVISAITSLPDRELGQIVEGVTQTLPDTTAAIGGLTAEYTKARNKIEGIVATVSKTALGSTLALAAFATIPLLVWLTFGWLLT